MGPDPVRHAREVDIAAPAGSLPAISRTLEKLREQFQETSVARDANSNQHEVPNKPLEQSALTMLETLIAARRLSPDWTGNFSERLPPEEQQILQDASIFIARNLLQKRSPSDIVIRYPLPQEGELILTALSQVASSPNLSREERMNSGFHASRIIDEYYVSLGRQEPPESFCRAANSAICRYVELAAEAPLDEFEKIGLYSCLSDAELRIPLSLEKRVRADFEIELRTAAFALHKDAETINDTTLELYDNYDLTPAQSDLVISLMLRAVDGEFHSIPPAHGESVAFSDLIERAHDLAWVSKNIYSPPGLTATIIYDWYAGHSEKLQSLPRSPSGRVSITDLSNSHIRRYILGEFYKFPDLPEDLVELVQHGRRLCPHLTEQFLRDAFDTAKVFLSGAYILASSFKKLGDQIESFDFDPEQTSNLCQALLLERKGGLRGFFQEALDHNRRNPTKYLGENQQPLGERTRKLYLSLLQSHLMEQLGDHELSSVTDIHALAEFCRTADAAIWLNESCSAASEGCPRFPISQETIDQIKYAGWALQRVLGKKYSQ